MFAASRFASAAPTASRTFARAFSASAVRPRAKITIIGNLAATPEVRPTSTGREIIEYAVASNSGPKDKRVTSWFRVASFEPEGPRRDFLTSLPKGAMVYVEGNCVMNTYEDAETGKSRSSLNVYQTDIEVLRRPAPTEGEQ
ncbi:Single-stranded DNA-binding protein RIM1 [Apiospora kogelbergensis]|uniref:Single-stranded DNA-binding protein RIM1 n=1 Tax=Apiospora kogelbergensis TaxID=1337665 RepID=A0AAW0QWV3_9PEZI